ncbi:MAG: hypothetical protein ACRDJH_22635 [Thermomicrobiales bacterium]
MPRIPMPLTGGLLLALLLAGSGIAPVAAVSEATPSPKALPAVVVTRNGGEASACGPRRTATIVASFVDAFKWGDEDRTMSVFGSDFKWFGVGDIGSADGRSEFFAYDPASGFASAGPDAVIGSAEETLPPYFAERQARGERWQLVDIGVYPEPDSDLSSIFFHIARRADDLPPGNGSLGYRYVGKGQVNCSAETIILWIMNPERPGSADDQPACPAPASEAPSSAIVARGPPSSALGPTRQYSSRS